MVDVFVALFDYEGEEEEIAVEEEGGGGGGGSSEEDDWANNDDEGEREMAVFDAEGDIWVCEDEDDDDAALLLLLLFVIVVVIVIILAVGEVLVSSSTGTAGLNLGSGMSNMSYMDISLIVSTSASSFTTSSISFRMSSIYLG